MRRVLFVLIVVAGVVPASAQAWSWPAEGPVLRPFVFGDDPYAPGQHRGIDIAGDLGADVPAPASGVVAFAGTVPKGGKTLSIRTPDGYAVSLQHLGSFRVRKGDEVAEGTPVATIGTSGEPDWPEPYVYLGIRHADDEQGYVDPLTLLPARPAPDPEPSNGRHGRSRRVAASGCGARASRRSAPASNSADPGRCLGALRAGPAHAARARRRR